MLQVMRDYGSSIDADAVKMMPYADAAIKEMLRLCGIAAYSPRIALKTFEIGGYTIPKVTHCRHCTFHSAQPFVMGTPRMLLPLFMLYAYSVPWWVQHARREIHAAAKLLLSQTATSFCYQEQPQASQEGNSNGTCAQCAGCISHASTHTCNCCIHCEIQLLHEVSPLARPVYCLVTVSPCCPTLSSF